MADTTRQSLEKIQAIATQALADLGTVPIGTIPIIVKPTDSLLAVLAAAPANAVVQVDPGFVIEADVVFEKPVTLVSLVPEPGTGRVTAGMRGPILRGALTSLAPGVALVGLRLEGKIAGSTIVTTAPGMMLDRCVVWGSPQGQHRAIRADSDSVKVLRTYIGNIWKDQDTQAIAAWDGCRNLLVDDCYLEASGENVLFGGEDAASAAGIPQDILIQNCTMFKPLSWIGKAGLTAKNLFETKCVKRLTVKNCRMENSWVNGQTGFAMLINVRNQNGAAVWSTTEDVVIEDCTFNNTVGGIQILGRDYTHPSQIMKNVMLRRLTFTNVGTGWPGGASGGWQVYIAGGPQMLSLVDLKFSGHIEPEGTAMTFDTPDAKLAGLTVSGCRFLEGFYGIHGTDAPALGKAVLDMYAPGYVWQNNTIVKGTNTVQYPITYPAGTTVVAQ